MIFFKKQIPILLVFLLLCGCSKQVERPLNLTIAKQRVEQYYESDDYENEMEKIIDRTIKHFKKVSPRNNATIVFDIDDTTLSNYADEKSISFGYIPKLFHEWVIQADAPAIPQTKKLYNYLTQRGFTIIFLTGRKHDEYDATVKNLKNEGFSTFDKLIVRQQHELKMSAKEYKTNRRKQLTQEGYKIVGSVGDQRSDLEGCCTGYQIKLPNYRYMIP